MFERSLYNEDQLVVLDKGLDESNLMYGDISDIDPRTHRSDAMEAHSTTRTDKSYNGCIRDLVGTNLDYHQLIIISMGRGSDPEWGNVDDLISKNLSGDFLSIFSQGRGTDEEYGNVDQYIGSNLSSEVLFVISLGLGNIDHCGDISTYTDLDKLEEYHAHFLSLGKGTNPNYANIWDIPELWLKSEDELETLNKNRLINTADKLA